MRPHSRRRVRQVVLPSGKIIEVVYFDAGADAPTGRRSGDGYERRPAGEAMHVCRHCGGGFVHPIDWVEAGQRDWRVWLHCPECEVTDSGVFDQDAVERFDQELDRGAEVLLGDLQRLAQLNMAEDVRRFIVALHADYVLPSDF